jgi:hypothetical protein
VEVQAITALVVSTLAMPAYLGLYPSPDRQETRWAVGSVVDRAFQAGRTLIQFVSAATDGPIAGERVNEERTRRIGSKGVLVIAAFLVGVAIGILVTWTVGLGDGAQTQVLEGYAWVNEAGTAIGLSPDGETPGASYVVMGALWREQSGPWHDTFPTCLEPLGTSQRIRLGVLTTRPQGEAPGRSVVTWLECLE